MSGVTSERLEELRRIAEAATPGPWGMNPENGLVDEAATLTPVCGMVWVRTEEQTLANAMHIASFDPSTVLVLLDEIERLRRERAVLAEALRAVHERDTRVNVTRFALYHPDLNWWECQACRFLWEFENGNPYDDNMRFCPRCGRRIVREDVGA